MGVYQELFFRKTLIPAYIFLLLSVSIVLLEVTGVISDVGGMAITVTMNLFLASILIPMYVTLKEISAKL